MAAYDPTTAGAGSRQKTLEIEIYDIDGTLLPFGILEKFGSEYASGAEKRLSLGMRMRFIDSCWSIFDLYKRRVGVGKIGDILERCTFKMYEHLFWRRERISTGMIEGYSKKYAGSVSEKMVRHVKGSASDGSDKTRYIVTVGAPRMMLEALLKERGIEEGFQKIYANDLSVDEGVVTGFDWNDFNCGRSGKKKMAKRMADDIEAGINSYDLVKISAFGDGTSDIGMFEELGSMRDRSKGKVSLHLYTFEHACDSVKRHVTENGGRILGSIDDYLTV